MMNMNVTTPPLGPILKRLRTSADLIDVSVQYSHDGVLEGEVSFIRSVNGSRGRLGKAQTEAILSFIGRNGLRPLVAELARFGTAVRY